jgi:hypothetical protein
MIPAAQNGLFFGRFGLKSGCFAPQVLNRIQREQGALKHHFQPFAIKQIQQF